MTIALGATGWTNASNSAAVTVAPAQHSTIHWISKTSSGAGTPTVTDVVTNGGAHLVQDIATFQDATTLEWFTHWYLKDCPAGITTLTATFNGGTPGTVYIVVCEVTGADLTNPLVTSKHNHQTNPGTATDAITSGTTATIGTLPALIIGVVANNNSFGDTVAGTGFSAAIIANNDWCVFAKRATTSPQQVTATAATHGGGSEYTTFEIADAEASAGTTITPSVGALVLAGIAATVANSGGSVTRTPTAGSLAFTGQQPVQTLTVGAAVPGALALTGQTPTVLIGTVRQPTTGALTISGQTPSLLTPRTITPTTGSLAFAGIQPTVVSGASNTTITPLAGTLSITGNAASLIFSSPVIRPTPGALAFTGLTPAVVAIGGGSVTGSLIVIMRKRRGLN